MAYNVIAICQSDDTLKKISNSLQTADNEFNVEGHIAPVDGSAIGINQQTHFLLVDYSAEDSLSITQELKASKATKNLPVAVFGSFKSCDATDPYIQAGADDIIPYPSVSNGLAMCVKMVMERHKRFQQVQDKSKMFSNITKAISSAGKAISIIESNGTISWVNKGFEQLYTCNLDEYKSIAGENQFESELDPEMKEAFTMCREKKEPAVYEFFWVAGSGTRKYIHTTLTPIVSSDGNLKQIVAIGTDMTSYKDAERALSDKHDNLLTTMDYLEQANNLLEEQSEEIEKQRASLEEEKSKTDALLQNILPFEVARQLTKKGYATPKKFKEVSVMFADFVGFTKVSVSFEDINEFLRVLGFYFEKFDEVTSARFIEKIKTIGDCYMCVGGVPRQNHSHPFDSLLAALEIQKFVEEIAQKDHKEGKPVWRLRIGIHTGSVVAGVIGKKKFAYDVWGDTVNVASRMESSGEAGTVNISETTYEKVKDYFKCTYRGKVPAKNIGDIKMFFVERILPEYSEDEHGVIPNAAFRKVLASY